MNPIKTSPLSRIPKSPQELAQRFTRERKCDDCGVLFSNSYGTRCPACQSLQHALSLLEDAKRELETRRSEYLNRIKELPVKYQDVSAISYDITLIARLSLQSAYLWGSPGTGKTINAIGAYHVAACTQRNEPKFLSYPSFIMHVQANYEESMDKIDSVSTHKGLVIIDDFGAQKMTPYVAQVTYAIINERDMNERHTIFTSNFSLPDIDKMVDGRVSSRIIGMCNMGANVMEFKGKDKRIR